MICPECGAPIAMMRTLSVETDGVKDLINFTHEPYAEMTQDQLKDTKDFYKLYKKYYKKADEDCDAEIVLIEDQEV
jgi:hypothetical protein